VLTLLFAPLRWTLRIVGLLLSLAVLYYSFCLAQVWLTSRVHASTTADAIVVFGTAEDNGTPSVTLKARLDEALVVWREQRAAWIATTGGKQPGDLYTEAGVSASYLEARGVPRSRILIGGDPTRGKTSSR
jgi:uncharacterized SAM-binding protein YcdF (DUF218 family)